MKSLTRSFEDEDIVLQIVISYSMNFKFICLMKIEEFRLFKASNFHEIDQEQKKFKRNLNFFNEAFKTRK